MTNNPGISIFGLIPSYYAGVAAPAGDINNDGFPDFMLCANSSILQQIVVWVIYGGPNLTNIDLNKILLSQMGL